MTQDILLYHELTQEQRESIFNVANPVCPFYGYIGNEDAVNLAITVAKASFNDKRGMEANVEDKPCARFFGTDGLGLRILLTGPRSVGKTTFAKRLHKLVGTDYTENKILMPFIEIDGTNIKSVEEILWQIEEACKVVDCPIQYREVGSKKYGWVMPVILFLDEIHGMPNALKESMLKMIEPNDGLLIVGDKSLNCSCMTIIGATTDPGDLKPALKSRFTIKIALHRHTSDQVAKIIMTSNPNFSETIAKRLGTMKPLPREALDTARLVNNLAYADGININEAFEIIVKQLGLDEKGMPKRAIDVMIVLAESSKGLSKKNICVALDNMEVEEFENDIMPFLMRTENHPPFITVGTRHNLTEAGINELKTRNLI